MSAQATINGVPVPAVEGLIGAVRADRARGLTKWSATTAWKGGFQCESRIRDHTVQMDEPVPLGGTDTGPNMVEAVLAAYGSCLVVGYTMNAARRGIRIRELRIDLEGDLDLAGFFGLSDEVPPGFSAVRAVVHLDADADADEIGALHDHVVRTSPLGCILKRPLGVSTVLA